MCVFEQPHPTKAGTPHSLVAAPPRCDRIAETRMPWWLSVRRNTTLGFVVLRADNPVGRAFDLARDQSTGRDAVQSSAFWCRLFYQSNSESGAEEIPNRRIAGANFPSSLRAES